MPKPISLDPDRRKKKKRKLKKREVDYTEYLAPPVIPEVQCPHTTRALDASLCSQCLDIKPSVVKRPSPTDWWAEDDNEALIEEISIEDFDGSHFVSLVDEE